MVNYNESHIYKICCRDTSIEDIYIGSTANFRTRKYQHKISCNNTNSKEYNKKAYQFIRDNGGWENWDMILLEEVNVNSKLELHKKEREFIELLKPSLNIAIPTRTMKEYQEDNKETLKEKKGEYYEKNKETIDKKHKAYIENNKEFISEKRKEKITCECGSSFRKADKARHNKTKKHIEYIN